MTSFFSLYNTATGEDSFLAKVNKYAIGNDPNCYKDTIQAEISGTIFEISGDVDYWGDNLPKNPSGTVSGHVSAGRVCFHKGDKPLKVKRIRIVSSAHFLTNFKEKYIPFSISVSAAKEGSRDWSSTVQRELKKRKISLEDLSFNGGFYILKDVKADGVSRSSVFYIAKNFKRPDGELVAYLCGSSLCGTGYEKNGLEYGISYLLDTGLYPEHQKSLTSSVEWEKSFYAVQEYIENLIVKK